MIVTSKLKGICRHAPEDPEIFLHLMCVPGKNQIAAECGSTASKYKD
jgi:hypothetical protein